MTAERFDGQENFHAWLRLRTRCARFAAIKRMSFVTVPLPARQRTMSPTARWLYHLMLSVGLMQRSGQKGWLGVETSAAEMGELLGVSERSVRRARKELKEQGLVVQYRRWYRVEGKAQKREGRSLYCLAEMGLMDLRRRRKQMQSNRRRRKRQRLQRQYRSTVRPSARKADESVRAVHPDTDGLSNPRLTCPHEGRRPSDHGLPAISQRRQMTERLPPTVQETLASSEPVPPNAFSAWVESVIEELER